MKAPTITPPALSDYPRSVTGFLDGQTDADCSVVTVTYNSAATLSRTLASVRRQSARCQHVIIDGGSTDATLDLARAHLQPRDILLSEPDRGIADAINKGIALAGASTVAILHSDDWFDDVQLATALRGLKDTGADFVFGDVVMYKEDEVFYREAGDPSYAASVRRRMPAVPHPSILYRREAFEQIGLFRPDLKLAMDYEWLLRSVALGLRGAYVPGVIAHMNYDGASNTRFRKTQREVRDIALSYGRPPLLAEMELWGRLVKTSIGRAVNSLDPALYLRLKKVVNPMVRNKTALRPE